MVGQAEVEAGGDRMAMGSYVPNAEQQSPGFVANETAEQEPGRRPSSEYEYPPLREQHPGQSNSRCPLCSFGNHVLFPPTVSEQQWVLFGLNFGTVVLLSLGGFGVKHDDPIRWSFSLASAVLAQRGRVQTRAVVLAGWPVRGCCGCHRLDLVVKWCREVNCSKARVASSDSVPRFKCQVHRGQGSMSATPFSTCSPWDGVTVLCLFDATCTKSMRQVLPKLEKLQEDSQELGATCCRREGQGCPLKAGRLPRSTPV